MMRASFATFFLLMLVSRAMADGRTFWMEEWHNQTIDILGENPLVSHSGFFAFTILWVAVERNDEGWEKAACLAAANAGKPGDIPLFVSVLDAEAMRREEFSIFDQFECARSHNDPSQEQDRQ